MDAKAIKEREKQTWTNTAPGWKKHDDIITNGAKPVADRMLELAAVAPGQRVLDIASGTGEPALSAAALVGESGSVLGTDLVDAMLEVARGKAAARGISNIEFRHVDGEAIEFDANSFDAATCRWGLMFMPDPVGCLRRAFAALKPGARMCASTWADPPRVPFASLPMMVLKKHLEVPAPPPGSPGIFGLADPKRLVAIMTEAGFIDVAIEDFDIQLMETKDGAEYWDIMGDLAGPITALIKQLPEDKQKQVHAEIVEAADAMRSGETLKIGGITLIVSGLKA